MGHAARLTIDLAALVRNWRRLGRIAAGPEAAAVVKADGYGLGLETVATALAGAGCRTFFVAHLSEGLRLRRALPEAGVYVLNGLAQDSAQTLLSARLRPVLGSGAELAEWRDLAPEGAPFALHVDTGMQRLGVRPEELGDLPSVLAPALVMSHFVSSEVPDDPVNRAQIARFGQIRASFPRSLASLSNSSGIFLRSRHAIGEDLVRPGYALYGGNPTPGAAHPLEPVVTLEASVIQVRHVRAGERVGYNGVWTAARDSRIATVSLGYADGYLRSGTTPTGRTAGRAAIDGRIVPIVGRVSMDLITLDVTELPAGGVARGTTVEMIGPTLPLDDVATSLGTNGYEVLTRLSPRLERRLRS